MVPLSLCRGTGGFRHGRGVDTGALGSRGRVVEVRCPAGVVNWGVPKGRGCPGRRRTPWLSGGAGTKWRGTPVPRV